VNSYALVLAIPLAGTALMPLAFLGGKKLENLFANIVCFLTAGVALSLIPTIGKGEVTIMEWLPGLVTLTAFNDGLSIFLVLVAACIGALIALYSTEYMAEEKDLLRYWATFTLFVGGMIGLALTSNLLFLYVFWEIVGLTSYALIGYYYTDPKGAKAGLKAFLTTRVGDVGLLVGVLALYFGTDPHTFNFFEIADAIAAGQVSSTVLAVAAFGMLVGAVGKSAQAPLHVWLADAMEAPTTISALIHAATMVNAGVYLMARTYPIFSGVPGWADTVLLVGAITAFLTGTLALVEPDFKRVLAYSTVSQLGYMFAAAGAGSILATQFHLINHAIFKALLFLCAGMVIHHVGSRNMYEMGGGVGREMKFTGTCYLIGTLSLCGIPILNGFWSKDLIIGATVEAGNTAGLVLLVLAAVLTVAYSFRAYYLVFCGERKGEHLHDPGIAVKIPLGILAVGALTSWLAVDFITGKGEASGLAIHAMNVGELIHHTISSVAVLYSLIAIGLGLLIYFAVKDTGRAIENGSPGLFKLLRAGYGFDGFYLAIFHGVRDLGDTALAAIDKYVLEAGVNRGIASFFVGAGKAGRALHPGDVSYNVIGVVTGLLLVIAVMFLAV
jgi:NADH-quinone oxidoreductase subunit L